MANEISVVVRKRISHTPFGNGIFAMTEQERKALMDIWAGIVVFSAVWFLSSSFFKALIVALFVYFSCAVGFGRRWLLPASFALGVFSIGAALVLPNPDQWADLILSVPSLWKNSRAFFASAP